MGESMRSTAKISSASELGLEPENNSDPERRLWAAVLLQAVEDWRSNNIRANRAAEEFLFKSALDFETVCHGAGFDLAAPPDRASRYASQRNLRTCLMSHRICGSSRAARQ
jgi:hypothetical protein